MSTRKTEEQVKHDYVRAMGEELGSLYCVLWGELAWLYAKWGEYVELFGTRPSRVELVNQAAGHFFRIVQDSLLEGSLLHIARLTDRPQTGKKENLTIRRLPDLIDDEDVRKHVAELIDTSGDKADFCRDWRNRHIAHNDLHLAMETGAEPLQPASRAQVGEALSAVSDVLNAVSAHYMDGTTMFEPIRSGRGAESLLYVLDDGLRAAKERRQRRKAGEWRVDDHHARDL